MFWNIIYVISIFLLVVFFISNIVLTMAYRKYTEVIKKQNDLLCTLHAAEAPVLKSLYAVLLKLNEQENTSDAVKAKDINDSVKGT
ncbi:MAG: hypothetical protein E7255_06205 [Lachnospiraceae bacterium]|nr:hypothetical protein [Lachnospiraceae bacterium]